MWDVVVGGVGTVGGMWDVVGGTGGVGGTWDVVSGGYW